MKHVDFLQFEHFEEQVHHARELFLAATDDPRRADMLRILQTAEATLAVARTRIGLDAGREEPQPWWIDWQARRCQD